MPLLVSTTTASFSTIADQPPLLHNDDPVDFRLTPNIQHFMTLTGIEGILTSSLVAIGRGLCQPEVSLLSVLLPRSRLDHRTDTDIAILSCLQFDLEEQLSLYMKDEVYHMMFVPSLHHSFQLSHLFAF